MARKRKLVEYNVRIIHNENGPTLEEALFSCSDLIMKLINEQLIWEKEQEILLEQNIAK